MRDKQRPEMNTGAKREKSPSWELFWREHGENLQAQEGQELPQAIEKNTEGRGKEGELHLPLPSDGEKQEPTPPEQGIQPLPMEKGAALSPSAKEKKSFSFPGRGKKREGQAPSSQAMPAEGEKKSRLTPQGKTILVLAACALLLGGTFYGAYTVFQQKLAAEKAAITQLIEENLTALAEDNRLALGDIEERMAAIDEQMAEIALILESTDQAILSSGAANREAMAKRIEELDAQLASLKKSLNILMESRGS